MTLRQKKLIAQEKKYFSEKTAKFFEELSRFEDVSLKESDNDHRREND